MAPDQARSGPGETSVTVRYWASARAVAGVTQEQVQATSPLSLAALVEDLVELHDGSADLRKVLHVCSVLVDDQPVSSREPAEVAVRPGSSVEFLPPFAGG